MKEVWLWLHWLDSSNPGFGSSGRLLWTWWQNLDTINDIISVDASKLPFQELLQGVNESAIWLSTIKTTDVIIFWSFNLSSFKNISTLHYQVIYNENYTKGKKTYFKRHTLMNNAYYETTAQFFSVVCSNINLFRIQRHWSTLLLQQTTFIL